MIVISPILVIIGMSNIIGKQFLLPTKQQTAYTISIISGAVVNFILNFILIRFYNATGASIATVLAEIAVTLVQCWFVRKQLPLRKCLKPFFRYLLLGFIMFTAVWSIGKFLPPGVISLLVMIVFGSVFYLSELLITKDNLVLLGLNLLLKKESDR